MGGDVEGVQARLAGPERCAKMRAGEREPVARAVADPRRVVLPGDEGRATPLVRRGPRS